MPPAPPAATTPSPAGLQGGGPLSIQPLKGWHLPLLQDGDYDDLIPLLQRALLLQGPERLLHSLAPRPSLAPDVLVAHRDPQQPLGVVVSERFNRSGSCWQLQHLRSGAACLQAGEAGRMAIEAALVRAAIQRSRGAASWIATSASCDSVRLAALRQLGFQPLRRETLWRWEPPAEADQLDPSSVPSELQLTRLNRRSASNLWQLEQAVLPAQLRQLLDRSVDDLLDQSEQPSLMLVDANRRQAVAGARRLRLGQRPVVEIELSLHPGWGHLLGAPLQLLLEQAAAGAAQVLVRCDNLDAERAAWLQDLGMAPEGEEVLMARSVWRRHAPQQTQAMAQRLEAVLGQLQPRQRPIPTPLGR
ncbi:hypothetical protein [Vulcanococcus sp.]|uniref:hypothetical protein n=1 Tax=Vulcanococcus sp. TaxID=2856995 RepID=UPI0037D9DB12